MNRKHEEKVRRAALDRIAIGGMQDRTGRLESVRFDGPRPDRGKRPDSAVPVGKPRECEVRHLDKKPCADRKARGVDPASLAIASGAATRLRGLLLSRPNDEALLLVPCSDVHTAGMRRRIDIAFVDDAGRVIEAHRDVGPMRRLRNRGAAAVLERFSSCSSPWFSEGDRLGVVRIGEVEA